MPRLLSHGQYNTRLRNLPPLMEAALRFRRVLVTTRICLGLQRRDARTLEHGVETGIIRQLPDGGYAEELRPASEEERAVLAAGHKVHVLAAADASGIHAPARVGALAKLRALANAAFTETAADVGQAQAPSGGHAVGESHDRENGQGEPRRAINAAARAMLEKTTHPVQGRGTRS